MGLELYRFMEEFFGVSLAALWAVFLWPSGAGRGVWLLVAGMLWVFWATPASAQVAKVREFSLKAAYLFNFTQFIEWPSSSFASAHAPIVVAVLGEDPFGADLEQALRGKTVGGRSFQIRRSRRVEDLVGGQVVYVCASEARRVPEILTRLQNTSALTVSDVDRFAERGGVISLYMDGNKVRFKVNLDAANRAGLKFSAQLLKLGKVIRENQDDKN